MYVSFLLYFYYTLIKTKIKEVKLNSYNTILSRCSMRLHICTGLQKSIEKKCYTLSCRLGTLQDGREKDSHSLDSF